VWLYDKNKKEYASFPQKATFHQFSSDLLLTLYFEKSSDKLLALAEDVGVKRGRVHEVACDVVSWRVKFTSDVHFRIWVDDDHLLRRAVKTIEGMDVESRVYAAFDLKAEPKDDAFTFTPPEGSRLFKEETPTEDSILPVGAASPEVEANDLLGKPVSLSSYGGKTLLLHFWNFGCSKCRVEEFPQLAQIQEEYRDRGVVVLVINAGDRRAQVQRYLETEKLPFIALVQKKDEIIQAFGVKAFPMNIVVGPDYKVAARIAGFPSDDLREALNRSLPKK
jgi:thiol-disulfide isomerase/thioredoxin